jgi:hypothetical protein
MSPRTACRLGILACLWVAACSDGRGHEATLAADAGPGDGATVEGEPHGGQERAARVVAAEDVPRPSFSLALHEQHCPEPAPAPPHQSGRFVDVSAQAGLTSVPQAWLCNANAVECDARSMSGGGAAADFDGDGLSDLYLARGEFKDQLLLNCGGGAFADVSAALGISKADAPSSGAVWGDVDSDGDLDLFVSVLGSEARRHYLYVQREGRFEEDGIDRGLAMLDTGPLYGTGAAFGDIDGDGFLDLYVGEWRDDNLMPQGITSENHARLFLNRGASAPGYFEDITHRAGLALGGTTSNGILTADGVFAFTPIFSDLDADGLLDLALSADYGSSRLFWNRGDGSFDDGTKAAGVGSDQAGMGADIGDFDGDGQLDWLVTSIYDARYGWTGNRLFRNLGARRFEDVSKALLMRDSGWGWGAAFADFDQDGVLDIFAVSGFRARGVAFGPQDLGSARLFRRTQTAPDDAYAETSANTLPKLPGEGRGVALLDFDADGDQDLLVGMHRGASVLLRNDQPSAAARSVRLNLVGKGERGAIGARVSIVADGVRQVREVHAGSGYLGQSEGTVHAGVPAGVARASVIVRWPSAQVSHFEVEIGRTFWVYEP